MVEQPHMFMQKVYLFEPDYDRNTILHMRNAGLLMRNPQYKHKRCMPDTLFEYVIDGEGYITYDGVRRTVKKGDFIISHIDVTKGKDLSYGSDKENPYLKLWFSADGRFIDALLHTFNIKETVTIINCDVLSPFQNFIFSLNKDYDTLEAMKAITEIMYIAFNGKKPATAQGSNIDDMVDAYIESNIQNMPPLSVAAADLGMDERSFGRYFKARFNENYKSYMRRQRLIYAQMMLRDKTHSIAEVATHLNFCDQSYFSNCFYKEFGMYPNEYRKQFFKCNK